VLVPVSSRARASPSHCSGRGSSMFDCSPVGSRHGVIAAFLLLQKSESPRARLFAADFAPKYSSARLLAHL
jgi:hypothetical protein